MSAKLLGVLGEDRARFILCSVVPGHAEHSADCHDERSAIV